MSTPSNFVDLQAGFYNALAQGLGYSVADPFQVIQPSPPLDDGDNADDLLWAYLNAIPPRSLTQNTILSGGNQFLANYQGVMSALIAAPNKFQSTIGPACFARYEQAVKDGKVGTTPTDFRNWALFNETCSAVATSGASALAAALLDPIFAAQINVLPYKPAGRKAVTFTPDFETMMRLLKKAPSRSFHVAANAWNSDVSKTWTQGSDSGFFGLWGGSSSESKLSQKFASSGVAVTADFRNVLPLMVTPGDWYSSSALGIAYFNRDKAPWNPESPINWESTFGPKGNLQRFCSSLLIANKMVVTVQSSASYSESEQEEIRRNSSAGLWPFYSKSSSSGSSTDVSFNAGGNMTVRFASDAGVPVVIGCVVLPADKYLGHENEAAKIEIARFYA